MSARDERKKKRKRKGASASKPRRVSERGAAKKGTAKKDTAKKGTAKKGAAEKGAAEKSAADGNQPREDGTHEAPALAPRQRFGHLLLAALGGALQCLGFAGFSLWPFALVCFLPMFYVVEVERPTRFRRLFALGLAHGFVGYTGGYYWLVDMLENFSGFEGWPNWAFASIFFLYQAGKHVLIYWVYARARRRGWPILGAAVASLLSFELIYPVLFPSFLSTGFHDVTPFIQIADLGGPMLVSAVVMSVNAALFELLWAWRRGPLPRRSPAIAAAAVALTLAYGYWRIAEVDARAEAAPKLTVGVVQVNMGIFDKRADPLEGHRRHLVQSRRLERNHDDLDLLVWPESAYTFFLREGVQNLKRRVLGPLSTPTLFGGLARREGEERMLAFNTAYLIDGAGDVLGTYDKTYLLMFGEYLPFGETFPILYDWSPNSGRFTPGDHVRPLELGDVRISTLICYEDVLPGFTREAVREGDPHLLVNITNDAWFGDTHEPWIHLALAKFRAVEHHRALVRSTNSGVSAFVDPAGRVLHTIGVFEQGEAAEELALLEGDTLYLVLGDWPGWAALFAMVWMSFVGRRRREDPAPEGDADDAAAAA
ncbi:MAG: apolipoprotein N-acyltransferase [Sandaracinus sp.]|nr:apolipoprotein N-acyltransferase [Sandaracinus sp.]